MTQSPHSHFLVLDVGTSGLRAALVDEQLHIVDVEYRHNPPSTPFDGLVEFDAAHLAAETLDAAHALLSRRDVAIDAVGITNQRASTVVWRRSTGEPIAAAVGWQDLRTITECIVAGAEKGWSLAPNQSITKLAWLLNNTPGIDAADAADLCFGTVDSWLAWNLSRGELHVSDATNMSSATGLRHADASEWDTERLDYFGIDVAMLPTMVDTASVVGTAHALPGAPPIAAMVGDQQASLVGQACVWPGLAKLTLGTGGMLNMVTGGPAPAVAERNPAGTYPLPAWQLDGERMWGVEAVMLSAGTNIEWLRDDLGIIDTSEDSHRVAQQCTSSDGVMYVPALLGLGTPRWDYGARGTLLGLTRGTERAHVVRAVLEGIAHRSTDLLEAAVADTGVEVHTIRVDGGMSANPTLCQALADFSGRTVETSPTPDATTMGAAFLAGLAIGTWSDVTDVAGMWSPSHTFHSDARFDRLAARTRWADAVDRAVEWHPELSALDF